MCFGGKKLRDSCIDLIISPDFEMTMNEYVNRGGESESDLEVFRG